VPPVIRRGYCGKLISYQLDSSLTDPERRRKTARRSPVYHSVSLDRDRSAFVINNACRLQAHMTPRNLDKAFAGSILTVLGEVLVIEPTADYRSSSHTF
jgi:hypothetical protein